MNTNHIIAAPYCAKCKRQVSSVQAMHNPMQQVHHLQYACHGEAGSMFLSHVDLVNIKPHNTLIDFVEFSRVPDDDGQNLHT